MLSGLLADPKMGRGERPSATGSHELFDWRKRLAVRRLRSVMLWSILIPMLSKLESPLPCEMKLFAEPVRFGAGKYFAIATDTGSMRSGERRVGKEGRS